MVQAKKEAGSLKQKVKNQKTKTDTNKIDLVAETVPVDTPKTPADTGPEANPAEIKAGAKKPEAAAKAGKRSAKSLREEAEKEAKSVRKTIHSDEKESKKETKKPSRPRHERAGKKYREAWKLIDRNRSYSLSDAIDLTLKAALTNFDSTVELHVNLGVDPKQADQNVRDSLVLPAGTGKTSRVAVLAEEDLAKVAVSAGADIADAENLLAQLDKEQIEFDILVATPASMPQLGKYARLLGPRGLMPNPKSGTVTSDVAKAVKEAKAGKVEYRVDQAGIVHLAIGKVSFGSQKIKQNADAAIGSINNAKPASLKGIYIRSVFLTTSMGPSVKVDIT